MDAVRNDKISQLLEARQNEDMRELNKAMNEFRMLHQQPESRREFDIYDPDSLKKDKPARVNFLFRYKSLVPKYSPNMPFENYITFFLYPGYR